MTAKSVLVAGVVTLVAVAGCSDPSRRVAAPVPSTERPQAAVTSPAPPTPSHPDYAAIPMDGLRTEPTGVGTSSVEYTARAVSRLGADILETRVTSTPPPGAALWLVYVDGHLRSRTSIGAPGATTGIRLWEHGDEMKVNVAAQAWSGEIVAVGLPTTVAAP